MLHKIGFFSLLVTNVCVCVFQMKKYKFSLQKAVNVPVNAIAPQSGAHLRAQIQKLLHLLSGSQVEVSGKHISAKDTPEGLLFSKNLIAKMIVVRCRFGVSRLDFVRPVLGTLSFVLFPIQASWLAVSHW